MQITMKLIEGQELSFKLSNGSYSIGRSSECDIIVKHDGMSRRHCKIDIINDEIFITDFGSTNGVMIDGKKLDPEVRTELKAYLSLTFGPVISFKALTDEEVAQNLLALNVPSIETASLTKTMPLKPTEALLNSSPHISRKGKVEQALRLKIVLYNIFAIFFLVIVALWYWKKESPKVKYDLTPKKAKPIIIKKEDEVFN